MKIQPIGCCVEVVAHVQLEIAAFFRVVILATTTTYCLLCIEENVKLRAVNCMVDLNTDMALMNLLAQLHID